MKSLSLLSIDSLVNQLSEENKIELYNVLNNTLEHYYVLTYALCNKEVLHVKIQLKTLVWNDVATFLANDHLSLDESINNVEGLKNTFEYRNCFGWYVNPVKWIMETEKYTEDEVLSDNDLVRMISEVPKFSICGFIPILPDKTIHHWYVLSSASLIIFKTSSQECMNDIIETLNELGRH